MSNTDTRAAAKSPAEDSAEDNSARLLASLYAAKANPATLLRIEAVQALTGLHRSTIWRRIKEDKFPASIDLGANMRRWRAGEVQAWLESIGNGHPAQ